MPYWRWCSVWGTRAAAREVRPLLLPAHSDQPDRSIGGSYKLEKIGHR